MDLLRFRAWLKKEQKMDNDVDHISWLEDELYCIGDGITYMVSAEDLVLMQSTGLKDKNGKEIFEGDIVKRYRSPFFKAKWEYQIETVIKEEASLLLGREFGKNFGTIPFNSPFAKSVLLEVVGNIYENPELLEDK